MNDRQIAHGDADAMDLTVAPAGAPVSWTLLIVDDDTAVHRAVSLALADIEYLGRRPHFLSAYSAAQARAILRDNGDVAVILLGAAMESDDAGRRLVQYMREVLNLRATRVIILYAEQSGPEPDHDTFLPYDIHDYKARTELMKTRLFTAVAAALRGYRQLRNLEIIRNGLRQVLDATSFLYESHSFALFADGLATQLSAILVSDAHGILCAQAVAGPADGWRILAGSGRFHGLSGAAPDSMPGPEISARMRTASERESHVFGAGWAALCFRTDKQRNVVVYAEHGKPFNESDLSLLETFGRNIATGYENLEIHRQLQDAKATLEQRVRERTRALAESENHLKQLKSAVEQSSAAIVIVDQAGIINYANPAAARTSGYSMEELLGRRSDAFRSPLTSHPDNRAILRKLRSGENWRGEVQLRSKENTSHWVDYSVSPVIDDNGVITNYVVVMDEISDRKKLEAELRHLATVDPLTGLFNRRAFFSRAERELELARQYETAFSVAMLDVDHFKNINDRYGHQAGDKVLRALSETCMGVLRERDIMGRMGGEEFALVLPETSLDQELMAMERLRGQVAAMQIPIVVGVASVSVSIGVAMLSAMEADIDAVLHRADRALYRAKLDGRNCIRSAG